MNKIFQVLLLPLAWIAFNSCEKKENQIFYENSTPPVLTATTSAVTLEPGLENNVALVLNWTNPNYEFTTGVSSHDVLYTLEMDTMGANFNSNKKVTTVIAKELSKSYTVAELNGILGNDMLLQLNPRRSYTLELRVTASIGAVAKVTSNTITFTARPFSPPPKVELPSTGDLFLVGDATPGGWDNPVPVPGQQFAKVSNTLYEITINLNGGKSLLFLPVNGDWGDKYGWTGSNNENNPSGDNLKRGGGDIKVPDESGIYKITVNFQLGVFSIVKQ